MTIKSFLYLVAIPIVIYALESININSIFKKGRVFQARLFYLMLTLSISYLIVNFCYDFFLYTDIL